MPEHQMKSVTKNGMTLSWAFQENQQIYFKLSTPSTGWAAIGLNTKDALVGSNLIMAAVSSEKTSISDRYIVGWGNHQSMEDLGLSSKVSLISATEKQGRTEIEFVLMTKSEDAYHFDLIAGKEFYLMMAYAHEDDFDHHSAMRTSVKIFF